MMKCHLCSDEADINILLYLGFVLVAVGVIITSVGLGDRGFRTLELRMVGHDCYYYYYYYDYYY